MARSCRRARTEVTRPWARVMTSSAARASRAGTQIPRSRAYDPSTRGRRSVSTSWRLSSQSRRSSARSRTMACAPIDGLVVADEPVVVPPHPIARAHQRRHGGGPLTERRLPVALQAELRERGDPDDRHRLRAGGRVGDHRGADREPEPLARRSPEHQLGGALRQPAVLDGGEDRALHQVHAPGRHLPALDRQRAERQTGGGERRPAAAAISSKRAPSGMRPNVVPTAASHPTP